MKILAQILAEVTRSPRVQVIPGVDFEWSQDSWTHNFFRALELVFWRRGVDTQDGIKMRIRAEVSAVKLAHNRTQYIFHTWEAALSHLEMVVRKKMSFVPVKVYIPRLITPEGFILPASPFLFAIVSTDPQVINSGTSISIAPTGSGIVVTAGCNGGSGASSTVIIKLDTTTSFTVVTAPKPTGSEWNSCGTLQNVSAGSHTVDFTNSSSGSSSWASSYSGCLTTGQPDGSGTGSTNSGTTMVVTWTVTATGCEGVLGLYGGNTATWPASATGYSLRVGHNANSSPFHNEICFDSNATLGTGSNSVTVNKSSTDPGSVVAFSLAPGASSGGKVRPRITLPLLGVA